MGSMVYHEHVRYRKSKMSSRESKSKEINKSVTSLRAMRVTRFDSVILLSPQSVNKRWLLVCNASLDVVHVYAGVGIEKNCYSRHRAPRKLQPIPCPD